MGKNLNAKEKENFIISLALLCSGGLANFIGSIMDWLTLNIYSTLGWVNSISTTLNLLCIIGFAAALFPKKKYVLYNYIVTFLTAYVSFPLIFLGSKNATFFPYQLIIAPAFGLILQKGKKNFVIGLLPMFIYSLIFISKCNYLINMPNADYMLENKWHILFGIDAVYLFCFLTAYYTNARLKDLINQLEKNSTIDPLTGAYNRQMLTIQNLERSGLIMVDIDFFKKLNDKYGHTNGDRSLQFLVQTIKSLIRKNDMVIRYGGEEFLIVINNLKDAKVLSKIAETIRLAVSTKSRLDKTIEESFTISLGCSLFNSDLGLEENIKVVDSFLYAAKNAGRNKVICV